MSGVSNDADAKERVYLRRQGLVATLVINNPEKHNAISEAMWQAIADGVDRVAADEGIRALVVTGAGGRAFSAGADISEFSELARDPQRLKANNRIVQLAQEKLETLARPTIARVDGLCFGGGCGLALACDFRFATPHSIFAITPAKLGLVYSWRDTRRLLALVGPSMCKEMLYTGKRLDARQALAHGMVNRVVAADQLDAEVYSYADELARGARYSIRGIKEVIASLEGYGSLTPHQVADLFDAAFTLPDCREGVAAFVEKRPPDFTRD